MSGLARGPLVLDDLGHDVGEDPDQLLFALAQGLLIRDLVEVAERLGPLAVEAADRQVDLLEGAEDLVDLLGLDQGGQVEHDADADAGADVGGAGRQVAELGTVGVGELLFELVVEAIDSLPDVVEREPREHHLDAEMVLLVDHDRDVLLRSNRDAARTFAVGELARDELALDQELAVELGEGVDVEVGQLELAGLDGRSDVRLDLAFFSPAGAVGKGEVGQVAGQADPRAHHDVALGSGAAKPLAGGSGQVFQIHSSPSFRRSWSRSRAACS